MKPLLTALFAALVLTSSSHAASDFSAEQKTNIEAIVRNYLINNPDILLEASKKLQQQEQSKLQARIRQAIAQHAQELFFNETSPVIGNPNGTVTLVEFFDYQCGHCKTIDPMILSLPKSNPQLRIILKPWPIFGQNSAYAATAALAAQEQGKGKYLAFHTALMKTKPELTPALVLQIAKTVGLNVAKLERDMKEPGYAQQLQHNEKLAVGLGAQGTPTFILAAVDPQAGPPTTTEASKIRAVFIPGGTNQATLQKLIGEIASKK